MSNHELSIGDSFFSFSININGNGFFQCQEHEWIVLKMNRVGVDRYRLSIVDCIRGVTWINGCLVSDIAPEYINVIEVISISPLILPKGYFCSRYKAINGAVVGAEIEREALLEELNYIDSGGFRDDFINQISDIEQHIDCFKVKLSEIQQSRNSLKMIKTLDHV